MVLSVLDHLRRPDHAAAGIVAAQDRHDHPVVGADVSNPRKMPVGMLKMSPPLQHHLARVTPAAPEERQRPLSTKNTSAVRWLCRLLRHFGGCPAAPI